MTEISDINRFDFSIRQKQYYCIPANIAVVTTYLVGGTTVTQDYVADKYQAKGGNIQTISLGSVKDMVLDDTKDFEFSKVRSEFIPPETLPNFDGFVDRVRHSIRGSLPHIISVPTLQWNGRRDWHMFTVVGYDNQNFSTFNSDPNYLLPSRYQLPIQALKSWLLQAHPDSDRTDSLVLRRA